MAMRVSTNPKKFVQNVDKGAGAFSCDGCQQSFCLKHVAEHRQELTSQMDNIELEHDIFNEDLSNRTKKQSEHTLFNRINQWEQESINKIEQVAKESRIALNQILDNIIDHGKKSLNKISLKLRRARELDDFFENDLARWTQQLSQLRAEIECMLLNLLKIVHYQTIENSDTKWAGNFSWLSDMRALFYDRSQKSSSVKDNEMNKYSTQTCTKGSVAIIEVNNVDHYVDIENDGLTENDQNMTGWILRRDTDKKSKIIYRFPDNFILKCRSNVRVLCVDEDTKSWDTGSHVVTYLIDDNGEEKASVIQTLIPL